MGANNVKALKLMGATKRKPSLRFHKQEIATVYDPPHLLKCTQDLFLKYDVQLKSELLGNQLPGIAKWDHILKLYELDKPNRFRLLYKLTDTHLNPVAQSAMKVSFAAQVMSHTVAAGLNTLVSTGGVCSEYLAVAEFVEEVDNLFDSLNGGTRVDPGKTLRCPLSGNSPYIGYWTEAIMGVSSWIFLKDGKPAFLRPPPSQNGWLIDIAAAQHVWRTMKEAGFKYLETRSLNRDPLENTFGAIRLYCGSSDNPSVGQFVDALKTSIINGLAFRGLQGTNCEDDGTTLLDDLHSFLRASDTSPLIPPQVTAGKTLMMFLIVSMLWRMYSRKWLLMYVQVTWKYCQ